MVYFRDFDGDRAIVPFSTRLLEDQGRGLVSALADLRSDTIYLRTPCNKPWYKAVVSVVICTYGRQESLNETLKSLTLQTFRDFEVLLITEKGDLSRLRHKGLECGNGLIVTFIDDDVYCEPTWLQSIVQAFKDKRVIGVTGPTTIKHDYRRNRDIFKYKFFRKLQDRFFLGNLRYLPSRLSSCGCPSMASNDENLEINSPLKVDYLEACNMSVRRKEALDAGGFDDAYRGTSEWCEVDLSLKIGHKGNLSFDPAVSLYHRPSRQGVYKSRLSTAHRWKNFKVFQRRWVKPSFKRSLYWAWVWTYLKLKGLRMI